MDLYKKSSHTITLLSTVMSKATVVFMGLGLLVTLSGLMGEPSPDQQVGSCHFEDYLRCSLVIAGCAAKCGADYNCMVNCVINDHHADCVDCIRSEVHEVGIIFGIDSIICMQFCGPCSMPRTTLVWRR